MSAPQKKILVVLTSCNQLISEFSGDALGNVTGIGGAQLEHCDRMYPICSSTDLDEQPHADHVNLILFVCF